MRNFYSPVTNWSSSGWGKQQPAAPKPAGGMGIFKDVLSYGVPVIGGLLASLFQDSGPSEEEIRREEERRRIEAMLMSKNQYEPGSILGKFR